MGERWSRRAVGRAHQIPCDWGSAVEKKKVRSHKVPLVWKMILQAVPCDRDWRAILTRAQAYQHIPSNMVVNHAILHPSEQHGLPCGTGAYDLRMWPSQPDAQQHRNRTKWGTRSVKAAGRP